MLKLLLFLFVISAAACRKSKKSDIEGLIIGGQPIKIEKAPFQVGFYYRDYFFCAGSIVSKTHIVTAAHCLFYLPSTPRNLTVRVGSSNTHLGGQVIQVKKISLHPKFSIRTVDYDVAVVELKTPLKYTSTVQPLKLGECEPKEGQEVRVSGWGFTREAGPPSRQLLSVTVKVVDRKNCSSSYKNRISLTNRMICAAAENKDACYGDSGGPMVWKDSLIGIVSTGEGCARKGFPGIYTSVANPEIRDFIKKESGLSDVTQ